MIVALYLAIDRYPLSYVIVLPDQRTLSTEVLHEHIQIIVSTGGVSLAELSPQPVAPLRHPPLGRYLRMLRRRY
jgi:hypothetical protein